MAFRVSHQSLFDRTGYNISQDYERYTSQQALVASGKQFLAPSDNPTHAAAALQARQHINVNEQFSKNIATAHGWLEYTDTQLNGVMKGLQEARAKVVQASNDITFEAGSPQRLGAAETVDAILEEMLTYANASYEGRFVFAGFKTGTQPFSAVRDASGEITGVTYNGNNAAVEDIRRDVAENVRMTVNVDGKEVFIDPTNTSSSEKVFNSLIQLRDDLRGNKPLAPADGSVPPYTYPTNNFITQHLTSLTNMMDTINLQRAEIGEKAATLTRQAEQMRYSRANITNILVDREDLDMAKGALQLTNQLNLYQAAINAGGKIVSPTLMQFLR
jgi:flagellar hook-associated protein 3 FlgL